MDRMKTTFWALRSKEGNFLFHGNPNHVENSEFPNYHVSPYMLFDTLVHGIRPVIAERKWELDSIRSEWNEHIRKMSTSNSYLNLHIVKAVRVEFFYGVKK